MEGHISPVSPTERDDAGEAVNQWSREEEAMRRPSLRTSLPLTGHSLANCSALNSPDRAPKTQRRRHSVVKLWPCVQPVHKTVGVNVKFTSIQTLLKCVQLYTHNTRM